MPNWCEGTIKMRGKRDNILAFFRKGINVYKHNFDDPDNLIVEGRELWYKETEFGSDIEIEIKEDCYIEGTRRAFLEAQTVDLYGEETETVTLNAKQAWSFLVDQFVSIAKEFNIDIRGYGIECGMEFCQEFEIVTKDGETTTTIDEVIQYDDWEWECPFPHMGG